MRKYLLAILVGAGLVAASLSVLNTSPLAAQNQQSNAVFDSDGMMKLPTGLRAWVFLGAALTPDGLNNGKAGFPEYHNVYEEKKNVDAYFQTGSLPDSRRLTS